MKVSQNIQLYIPSCCKVICKEKHFSERIEEAMSVIRSTHVGRQILAEIAACDRGHTIYVSTHSISEGHLGGGRFFAKADSPAEAQSFSIGSGSSIFIPPEIEDYLPPYYTNFHQQRCVARLMVSESCGDPDSPCNRVFVFAQALFHELVHARNNLFGENRKSVKDVPLIFRDREEYNTIQLENSFLDELSVPFLEQRWGHTSLINPIQQKMLNREYLNECQEGIPLWPGQGYRAYSRNQKNFLIVTIPSIITLVGLQRVSCMLKPELPSASYEVKALTYEEQHANDDLYE